VGRIEPAERLVMPVIAKIEFMPDAEGRLLVFVCHDPPDAGRDTAQLIRTRESFLGVPFEQLGAAGARRIIPDGKGGGRIEAESADDRRSDRRHR
jgi:hypothetical protein